MAAAKSRTTLPVGSTQWILNERDQVDEIVGQENEDFAFSARNEFDWLNEHMVEIFSDSQMNITEIFKTPGKLRGKTPRTARKRNALETRAPLTDVFASDIRYNGTPSQATEKGGKKLRIQSPLPTQKPQQEKLPSEPATKGYHADSGYQGSTEDEMDVDAAQVAVQDDLREAGPAPTMDVDGEEQNRKPSERSTEDSFHSARENVTLKQTPAMATAIPGAFPRETPMPADEPALEQAKQPQPESIHEMEVEDEPNDKDAEVEEINASPSVSDASSPEKAIVRKSSLTFATLPPRDPLATKKSIGNRDSKVNNAEPRSGAFSSSYFGRFTGGKSLGFAQQQDNDEMDLDKPSRPQLQRGESEDDTKTAKLHSKSSTQRLHERINLLGKAPAPRPTKSIPSTTVASAQEQAGYPDLSKPNEQMSAFDAPQLPEIPQEDAHEAFRYEEDDWILPPANNTMHRPQLAKSRSVDVMENIDGKESIGGEQLGFGPQEKEAAKLTSPARMDTIRESGHHPYGHKKSVSTTILPSPRRPIEYEQALPKAISVSNPTFRMVESTTPAGSPAKFHLEGHLSASKSKLQSIMKSARGLFTSSAGISAQAKMEALSPPSSIRIGGLDEIINATAVQSADLYPKLRNESQTTISGSPGKGRKLRSSTEKEEKRKEKEARDRERAESDLAKARGKERQKAKEFKEKEEAKAAVRNQAVSRTLEDTSKPVRQSPRRLAKEEEENVVAAIETKPARQMAPPAKAVTQTHSQTATAKKTTDARRPIKPAAKPATKPPQVAIRVGPMRMPLTNSALSSSLQDTLSVTGTKQPGLVKKPSNASILTTASTASFKSSTSGTSKPKSLVVAAQKKEQAEKEAQRKEDEKRERERKRAAAHEEAQRKAREQMHREEADRQKERERVAAEEAKRKAQKEAADKKRAELSKKTQIELAKKVQQHQQQEEQKKSAIDLTQSIGHNKPPQPAQARTEHGNARPPSRSRMDRLEDFPKPPPTRPINPAKAPIKRVFDPDNDDELSRPSRPTAGHNYQQNQDKRRRTEDEDDFAPVSRPTQQPPVRQSNIRKMQTSINQAQAIPLHKPNVLSSSYQQSSGYASQHHRPPGNPMDIAKYQSGKIPFAADQQMHQQSHQQPPQQSYKTPSAAKKTNFVSASKTNRSSPGYGTNGDHIHLDDIATESEDEDSEDERRKKRSLPNWVRTPVLFEQLGAQEQLNPDAVFGPIAPLNMEEMFRDKSRHGKFRARTSSANWGGSDRLTEDDIRNDNAAREKMRKDGAWSFRLGES